MKKLHRLSSGVLILALAGFMILPAQVMAWCAAMGGFPSFEAKARFEREQARSAANRSQILGIDSPSQASTQIRSDQTRLKSLGYYRGDIDGLSGSAFRSSIESFRSANSLGPGTTLDAQARAVLNGPSAVAKSSSKTSNSPMSPSTQMASNSASVSGIRVVNNGSAPGNRIRLSPVTQSSPGSSVSTSRSGTGTYGTSAPRFEMRQKTPVSASTAGVSTTTRISGGIVSVGGGSAPPSSPASPGSAAGAGGGGGDDDGKKKNQAAGLVTTEDKKTIKAIQTVLADLGLYKGPADGEDSAALKLAIRSFKHSRGLVPEEAPLSDHEKVRLFTERLTAGGQ